MKKALLFFGALVCAALVGILVRQEYFYHPEITLTEPLADLISDDLPGWDCEELELASSPEMRERTEDILNFEEAIYRRYTQGDRQISVYVAYWKPKQMPVRLVEAHTPDICWVRNGWQRMDAEEGVDLQAGQEELFPAEYRTYTHPKAGSDLTYVYYWHTVGESIYVNRVVGEWDRLDPIKTIFKYGLNQMQEQFFVRISSNMPFGDVFEADPGMHMLIQELADLTLAPPPEAIQAEMPQSST
ncbi:MAG: exosortase-associated EpsI family protein [Puniceicoccales bacterium]